MKKKIYVAPAIAEIKMGHLMDNEIGYDGASGTDPNQAKRILRLMILDDELNVLRDRDEQLLQVTESKSVWDD